MNPILIIGCSKRKLATSKGEHLKAGTLYDGAAFRVYKAWQRRHPSQPVLSVLILSAKHGLIDWETRLGNYDVEMTVELAESFRPQVEGRLLDIFPRPTNAYVEMGRNYLRALPDLGQLWPTATVSYGAGRIGERMHELRRWLELMSTLSAGR